MFENNHRRQLFARTIAIISVVALALMCVAAAQSSKQNGSSSDSSFGPIKQIDAGLLNVGYVEAGPTDGAAVILLHG